MRDGLGPYLGVFLKGHQFGESHIGLTSASLCALIFGIPLGIFIDKTRFKRGIIALCIAGIVLATGANYFYPHFIFTLMAQIAIALCAVCLAPAFSAITLGLVGQSGYSRQVSLNEAYKHAGTAFSAGLSLYLRFIMEYACLMGVALFELIVRGGVGAHFDGVAGMVVVQILDGVGAGV